jgi:hypothetical protein
MPSVPNQETRMPDEPTQPSPTVAEPAADRTAPAGRQSGGRATVSVPSWLAAALVVLLGLAIGAAGFALGRVTDGNHGGRHGFGPPVVGRAPGRGSGGGFGGFGPRGSGGFGGFGGGANGGATTPTTPTAPTPPTTAA